MIVSSRLILLLIFHLLQRCVLLPSNSIVIPHPLLATMQPNGKTGYSKSRGEGLLKPPPLFPWLEVKLETDCVSCFELSVCSFTLSRLLCVACTTQG